MKFKFAFVIAAICMLVGCSDDKPTLYVYNWQDYIDPQVIIDFANENDCHVVVDGFDDNEAMVAKLLAGGGGYDVVFPSSYAIRIMAANDLIQKIPSNKIDNVIANFDTKYSKLLLSTNMEWSVPYALSVTGLALRNDKCDAKKMTSWNCVFDESLQKRVCMLNDIREMLGIGLILNGYSVNSTNSEEIAKATDTIIKFKSAARKLDNAQYKTGLASAEFYVAFGYNSDVLQLKNEDGGANVDFIVPDEGSTCCFDEMVIMKGAKLDLACKFINYMYRPEVAAANAKYTMTTMPNIHMMKHLDSAFIKQIDIDETTLKRLELIRDVGENISLYNKAWDKFKAAH